MVTPMPSSQEHDQDFNNLVAKWEENPEGEMIGDEFPRYIYTGKKIKVIAGKNSPNFYDRKSWPATITSEALVVVDDFNCSDTKLLVSHSKLSCLNMKRFGEIVKMITHYDIVFGTGEGRQVRLVGGYFWKCCAGEPMEGESLTDFKARSIEYTVKLEDIVVYQLDIAQGGSTLASGQAAWQAAAATICPSCPPSSRASLHAWTRR